MTEVEQRPYLTLHEAAQRLQKSVDDCYRMVRTGELPYVRVGRSIRIPFYAVEGLLSVQRAPVVDGAVKADQTRVETSGDVMADVQAAPAVESGDNGVPHAIPGVDGDHIDSLLAQPATAETRPDHVEPARPPAAQPWPAAETPAVTSGTSTSATPADPVKVNPPASPWAQVPVVIQTGQAGLRKRVMPALKRVYRRANDVRVPLPFRASETAVLVVSDSNLRAIVVKDSKVRFWGTVALKEGVVRDGAVVDAPSFMTAVAALEARLAGPRMVGRPIGVVVSGRNLVIGRFQTELPTGHDDRDAMRRLVCEKFSVRPEDMTVDYHMEGVESHKDNHKGKKAGQEAPAAPRELFGIAVLRSVLESVARPVAAAGSRVTIAQPKAVALAAASVIDAAIVVDLEPASIAVIIVRGGLAEVVRDVTIGPDLRPPQVAQILAGQVNRSVGYYNARYPGDHLPPTTPIFVTGEGAVDPSAVDLALATFPYPRELIANPFEAPDTFPAGAYAAALGAAQQELARHARSSKTALRPSFDLLPDEFKPRPLPVRRLVAASAAAVLLAGAIPAYQAVADVSSRASALGSTVERLESQVRSRSLQLRKIATIQGQLRTTNGAVEKLVAAELAIKGSDRAFAVTLGRIHEAVPEGVALGEVDDDGGLVEVAASAENPDDLFAFVRALSAVKGFSNVRIKSIALDPKGVKASIKVSRDTAILNGMRTPTAVEPASGDASADGTGTGDAQTTPALP